MKLGMRYLAILVALGGVASACGAAESDSNGGGSSATSGASGSGSSGTGGSSSGASSWEAPRRVRARVRVAREFG